MKQEIFGFILIVLALVGGLTLARYEGMDDAGPAQQNIGTAQLGNIYIEGAWAAETIGAQNRSAAYFTLHNRGEGEDRLIGAIAEGAAMTHLHRTVTEDNISRMEPIGALILQPGTTTMLMPGGYHLMLMGLDEALVDGGSILLTLQFMESGDVSFEIPIRSRTEMMAH